VEKPEIEVLHMKQLVDPHTAVLRRDMHVNKKPLYLFRNTYIFNILSEKTAEDCGEGR